MTGWSYTSADGHPGFSALHPIQSGVDAGATAIRPMTPTEGAIYQALQGYMQVHPRMQGEMDRLAASLAAAEAERDALALRVGELEADKARLDFLDRCNARLNAAYGTTYRWRLVLSHNVTRLMLGHGDVDLHDSDGSNTALPSCREAIDERLKGAGPARALRLEPRP